jgi:hypothetical protein
MIEKLEIDKDGNRIAWDEWSDNYYAADSCWIILANKLNKLIEVVNNLQKDEATEPDKWDDHLSRKIENSIPDSPPLESKYEERLKEKEMEGWLRWVPLETLPETLKQWEFMREMELEKRLESKYEE